MDHWKKRIAIFRRQPFRWHFIGCLSACIGGGLFYVSISWLLININHSVSAIAMMMASFWIPSLVFAPFMGTIIDRYPRKWLVFISNVLRVLVLFCGYGVYSHQFSAVGINVISFFMGCFLALYWPASVALLQELVPQEERLYANATLDTGYEIGNMIGMGSAGLLLTIMSPMGLMSVTIAFFIFAAFSTFMMKHESKLAPRTQYSLQKYFEEMKAGFTYVKEHRLIRMIYTVQLVFFVVFLSSPVLLAPYAKNILHLKALQFGNIEATFSVGVIIGSFLIPYWCDKYGYSRVLISCAIFMSLTLWLFPLKHSLIYAEVMYGLLGFSTATWPMIMTKGQELTAISFQGRVQAMFSSGSSALIIIIYLLTMQIDHYLSIQVLYWLEALLSLYAAGWIWRFVKAERSHKLEQAIQEQQS